MMKLSEVIVDIAAGPFGSNLKVECFVPSGFPIIDGANLKGFKVTDNITKFVTEEKARSLHRSIAKRGDVISTISGTLGQIAYIPEDSEYEEYLVSQRQFRVSFDKNKVDIPYIVYYFHSREGQNKILSFANQVGVPALAQPLKNFRNIELTLPPLPLQRRISSILTSLDRKIELNHSLCQKLEEMASTLFRAWFIDFLPFKNQELIDSPLGRIPKGWKVGTLGEIATITSGKRPPKKQAVASDECNIPIFGASKIMGYTNNYLYNERILITGRVGTHGIIHYYKEKCWPSDNTLVIISKCVNFCLHFLKRVDYRMLNRGGVQPLITQGDLQCLEVVMPPDEIMSKFNQLQDTLFNQIDVLKQETLRLTTLRDTLLPRLMSGELEL